MKIQVNTTVKINYNIQRINKEFVVIKDYGGNPYTPQNQIIGSYKTRDEANKIIAELIKASLEAQSKIKQLLRRYVENPKSFNGFVNNTL